MSFNQNFSMDLGTEDTAVPSAGAYFVEGKLQLPRLASGSSAASAVVATVTNLTGPVTIYTGAAGNDGFYVDFNAAAGDIIRVALTSSAAVDNDLNNSVKAEISIGSGQ